MPMMLLLINKITFFFLHLAFCLSLRKFIAYGSRFPTSKLWVGTVGSLPALGSSAGGANRAQKHRFKRGIDPFHPSRRGTTPWEGGEARG